MIFTPFRKKSPLLWAIVALGSVLLIVVGIMVLLQTQNSKNVYDFQSCQDAGGAILESYPEQCLLDGKTYVNESQATKSEYVGLTEQAAMDKAKAANVPHRVVERDNESLAVTMDYVVGRLNFHVRNGYVVSVDVEGVE